MVAASAKSRSRYASPDLSDFRRRYPLTVASFGSLADREAWLRRIWEMDERLQREISGQSDESAVECIIKGAPPAHLSVEAEFEIIYTGGALGLLHAAVMSHRYRRRVLFFDERTTAPPQRGWHISREDLREFERAELFSKEEIEASIVNRYRSGFVKFHDAASRIKAPPLWISDMLDVGLASDKLLTLAAQKTRQSATGSILMEGLRFVRCYVQQERVSVEVEETRTGRRKLFAARLFIDASDVESRIAQQLNDGQAMTHVRPTVGTIARGFVRGQEPDKADFSVGEILVSNEDARDHRQLLWEGAAGNPLKDEYATSLFFYDAVGSPADKSLLSLFERYFETLPAYKRTGANWRVLEPFFGFIPSFQARQRRTRRQTTENRLMLIGDAAHPAGTLTLCGFGAQVRALRRLTHLTELALRADLLDAASLNEINTCEPRVAQLATLSELMRPAPKSQPAVVNETMNAVMTALHDLDESARRDFFQDRMSFSAFKNLLTRTVKLYPRILQHVREHLGTRGTFWWLAQIAESMLHERRDRRAPQPLSAAPDEEDAGREFARQVARYRNKHADEL